MDVLPTLETLHEGLVAARGDEGDNPANVVQIACHAAVLLVDKYSAFSGACDIYIVAIGKNPARSLHLFLIYSPVMCPDHKLKWFQDHGRDLQQIKSIRSIVRDYWDTVYAGEEENELREEENKVIVKISLKSCY